MDDNNKKLAFRIKSDGYLQIGYSEKGNWVNEEHCGNPEWVLRLVRLSKSMLAHINQNASRTKKMDILERNIEDQNNKTYQD